MGGRGVRGGALTLQNILGLESFHLSEQQGM